MSLTSYIFQAVVILWAATELLEDFSATDRLCVHNNVQ